MSTYGRREREKRQRRQDILKAAEQLFDEKGFQGATIDQIARRTELSKGTIYLYFRSKDEIFLEVCTQGIVGFRAELEASVLRKRGLENKIKAMYLAYIDYFMKVPHVFRVLADTYTERIRSNLSTESINRINWTIAEALYFGSLFVQQGIDSGAFRSDVDPYEFSVMAWRTATSLIELAVLSDPKVVSPESSRKMLTKSIDLLVDGLKAENAPRKAGSKPADGGRVR